MKDYKKILEGVVDIINTAEKSDIGFANICTYIGENCPELKEPDDERIIKALRERIIRYDPNNEILIKEEGISQRQFIAWLEKQGEQPKKHDVCDNCDQQGSCVSPCPMKLVEKQGGQKSTNTKEYDFHGIKFMPKFTKGDIIKDKKCGEVSTIEGFSYDTGLYTHTYGQFPITIQDNYELVEQKSSWSEEDERIIMEIISDLDYCKAIYTDDKYESIDNEINWLKSLRPQSQWKPSERQKEALLWCVVHLGGADKQTLGELLEELNKL